VHTVAPSCALNVPGAQALHTVAPLAGEKPPLPHNWQAPAVAFQN